MKEIIYQAWDTRDKRMIDWRELLDYGSGLAEYFRDPRELIFREFTGLKDKLGKPIYEGDIWELGDSKGEIIISPIHGCCLKCKSPHGKELEVSLCAWNKGEVIGNIYEGLLKE